MEDEEDWATNRTMHKHPTPNMIVEAEAETLKEEGLLKVKKITKTNVLSIL